MRVATGTVALHVLPEHLDSWKPVVCVGMVVVDQPCLPIVLAGNGGTPFMLPAAGIWMFCNVL
jgi:hypothetical protein